METVTFTFGHRIKISNRRATQRCKVSAYFYAKICSLLARRRSSQPVQRVYWSEDVIDWLGKWRPTCVMRHARGQKLQSFRRKWPFYMDLYSMTMVFVGQYIQLVTSHVLLHKIPDFSPMSWRTRGVSILFQNHSRRYEKLVSYLFWHCKEQRNIRCERDSNSYLRLSIDLRSIHWDLLINLPHWESETSILYIYLHYLSYIISYTLAMAMLYLNLLRFLSYPHFPYMYLLNNLQWFNKHLFNFSSLHYLQMIVQISLFLSYPITLTNITRL
jgi:hypothetical protein